LQTNKLPGLSVVKRHACWWLAGIGLATAVTQVALPVVPYAQEPDAVMSKLDAVYARCMQDMLANTCKVMETRGAASSTAGEPGSLVFIAGVGAMAASDYQQLYAAGDAMCTVVRDACTRGWGERQCLTARKLWERPEPGRAAQ
jgi:hypothetical protein